MRFNLSILRVATLYCIDREEFNQTYGHTLHKDYLDSLFLGAATRPELAEQVALAILGYKPKTIKHGPDGSKKNEKAEAKIRTTSTIEGKLPQSFSSGSITINDPSQSIIDEYDREHPLFIFAYFIDGHLAVVFSTKWCNLSTIYRVELGKIKAKLEKQKSSRSFSLLPSKWLEEAKVEFIHPIFLASPLALPHCFRGATQREEKERGIDREKALKNAEQTIKEIKEESETSQEHILVACHSYWEFM